MSSNIGPEAKVAYQKYLDASSLEEKINKLEEFISLVPKHKSTEKIVALNRSRLAKLKRELEERKHRLKSAKKVVSPFSIKKEGIQVIFVSDYHTPGVGKTMLLNYLTGAAKDKIGKFTTLPEIGIYEYKGIRFQIVDMPSLMEGASKGIGNGKEILSQLRSSDLICLCIDLSRDIYTQMDVLLTELSNADVKINVPPPPISVEKTGSNKIQIYYITKEAHNNKNIEKLNEKIKEVFQEAGIRNAIVKIYGEITIGKVVDALTPSIVYKNAIILGTKGDLPQTEVAFHKLKSRFSDKFPLIIGTSVQKKNFPKNFGEIILKFLKKIKIFTMDTHGTLAEKPLIMDEGSTVRDVALRIHRSFFELFDYAIVVRESARQKRKKVGLKYTLKNNDIIEIHTV